MALLNYILIGVLGTIVGIALYMEKMDISREGALHILPGIERE
jgi:putative flippase GtrA